MLNVQTPILDTLSLYSVKMEYKKRLKNKPLFIVISLQKLLFALHLNALVRFFSSLNHYLKRD